MVVSTPYGWAFTYKNDSGKMEASVKTFFPTATQAKQAMRDFIKKAA